MREPAFRRTTGASASADVESEPAAAAVADNDDGPVDPAGVLLLLPLLQFWKRKVSPSCQKTSHARGGEGGEDMWQLGIVNR